MDRGEASLARAARGGDREAFAQLVRLNWTPLVSLARSVIGSGEAEDAVQEAFVDAWKGLRRLRRAQAFKAWIRQIVVRRCMLRAGRGPEKVAIEDIPEPVAPRRDSGARLDVERLLASLAPRQRVVMHLTAVEGMNDREIGEALDVTPATVRSHRRRARETLKKHLGGKREASRNQAKP